MILVGIGGNLPAPDGTPPLVLCQRAVAALDQLPGVRLVGKSSWYETAPVPPSDQPRYINGVARLEGEAAPEALLRDLQALEAAFGRVRGEPNAARTLDLDLIDLNGMVRAAPDPVLPHPRAHLRAFVLRPLAELAPDWVHPMFGRGAAALLAELPPQDIAPIGAPIGLLWQGD
jgi:2-amino-4-hydroxy-6-hydroxymethyldihydropteridine diphosphokinase